MWGRLIPAAVGLATLAGLALLPASAAAADSAGAAYNYNSGTGFLELRFFIASGSSPVDSMNIAVGSATTVSSQPSGGVCAPSGCPEPGESGTFTAHGGTATFSPPAQTNPGEYGYLDMHVSQDPGSVAVQFNYHNGDSSAATASPCGTLSATPATLPDGQTGTPYSQQLTGQGGAAPYSFALQGVLPAGISLSSAGLFSGTPGAGSDGAYSGSEMVVDGNGCSGTQGYQLTVDKGSGGGAGTGAVTVSTTLSSGGSSGKSITIAPGAAVSDAIQVSPVQPGATPTGAADMTLYPGPGCSGQPAAFGGTDFVSPDTGGAGVQFPLTTTDTAKLAPGTYSVLAHYSGDSNYAAASSCDETITVQNPQAACSPQLTIGPDEFGDLEVGVSSHRVLYIEGGPGPLSWDDESGELPPGMRPTGATTVNNTLMVTFGGVPTKAGTYTFTLAAVSGECRKLKTYTVVVRAPVPLTSDEDKVEGNGTAPVGAKCVFTTNVCEYFLTMEWTPVGKSSHGARVAGASPVSLGTVSGRIPGGRHGELRLKLNSRGRALLRSRHRLVVKLIGTLRQGRKTTPLYGSITIRLAKR